MLFDDAACFRGPGAGKSLRTADLAARVLQPDAWRAKRRLGVVAQRVRKDGQALWQWSDPALPHGAGRRR